MPKRVFSVGRGGRAIPFALLLVVSATGAASAAASCLTSPTRPADPGTRWYSRIDTATQQRCWYLKEVAPRAANTGSAEAASPNEDGTIMSWFSSTFGGIGRPNDAQQTGTTGTAQAAPPGAPRSPPRPAPARAAPKPPAQPSPPTGSAPRTGSATAVPFDRNTRDALFKEYVEWRKRKGLPAE